MTSWVHRWRYAIAMAIVGLIVLCYFLDSLRMYFEVTDEIDRCERAGYVWLGGHSRSVGCYNIERVDL